MWYNKAILIILSLSEIIQIYRNCIAIHEFDDIAKKLGGAIGMILGGSIEIYVIITLFNLWW